MFDSKPCILKCALVIERYKQKRNASWADSEFRRQAKIEGEEIESNRKLVNLDLFDSESNATPERVAELRRRQMETSRISRDLENRMDARKPAVPNRDGGKYDVTIDGWVYPSEPDENGMYVNGDYVRYHRETDNSGGRSYIDAPGSGVGRTYAIAKLHKSVDAESRLIATFAYVASVDGDVIRLHMTADQFRGWHATNKPDEWYQGRRLGSIELSTSKFIPMARTKRDAEYRGEQNRQKICTRHNVAMKLRQDTKRKTPRAWWECPTDGYKVIIRSKR